MYGPNISIKKGKENYPVGLTSLLTYHQATWSIKSNSS